MTMYQFQKIQPTIDIWNEIERSHDSTIFHTREWNTYLERIGIKPYVITVLENDKTIGYFIGQRFLCCIVTAPIEGIGTYTQGLCMCEQITEDKRVEIYKDLFTWLYVHKQALLLQVDDWQLRRTSAKWIPYEQFHHDILESVGYNYSVRPTLCVLVNTSENEMWRNLHYKSCKYSINKARKLGLYVKEVTHFDEIDAFTKNHYAQLKEVCARQGMHPKASQQRKRMKALCESLFPNRIIMLEVLGNDENGVERIMASGIFCIDKGECIYWTGASSQCYHKYCPNELLVWEAMRLANMRGGGEMNFGGMHSYKLKYGTVYEYIPRIAFAKYNWMLKILPWFKTQYYNVKRLLAKILGTKSKSI